MVTRRHFLLSSAGFLALSACADPSAHGSLGPEGQPLPVLYRIDAAVASRIPIRMLGRVNAERAVAGAPPLRLDPALGAAATAHARDMAQQNRPGHVGSDASSPAERAERTGYRGTVLGEAVAETYEPELATIADWMARADTRAVITDAGGRDLGVGFDQEDSGKIWWTLMVGAGAPR